MQPYFFAMQPEASYRSCVFWDYDNCQKPKDVEAATMFESIRKLVEEDHLGQCDMTVYTGGIRLSDEIRISFHDLGMNTIDTSKGNKKERSDLRMIADMAMFALDRAQQASFTTIILISGDTDFGHLLANLRRRGFRIYIICKNVFPRLLSVHAHRGFRLIDLLLPSHEIQISQSKDCFEPTNRKLTKEHNSYDATLDEIDVENGTNAIQPSLIRQLSDLTVRSEEDDTVGESDDQVVYSSQYIYKYATSGQITNHSNIDNDHEREEAKEDDDDDDDGGSISSLKNTRMGSLLAEMISKLAQLGACAQPVLKSRLGLELRQFNPRSWVKGVLHEVVQVAVKEGLVQEAGGSRNNQDLGTDTIRLLCCARYERANQED